MNLACFVCGKLPSSVAVFDCDHHTCATCALKLRLVYKDTICPYCKAEVSSVVISDKLLPYSEVLPLATHTLPKTRNFFFTSPLLKEETHKLLSFHCSQCPDTPVFKHGDQLAKHSESFHSLPFCRICLNENPKLPGEHTSYSKKNLTKHLNGELSHEHPFVGHPKCPVCQKRVYNDEALFYHVVKSHIICHLCQHSIERTCNWGDVVNCCFKSQQSRLEHFCAKHFVCHIPTCLENNLAVFDNELDLARHTQADHGKNSPILLGMFSVGGGDKNGGKTGEKHVMSEVLSRAEVYGKLPEHLKEERSRMAVERVRSFFNNDQKFENFLNLSSFSGTDQLLLRNTLIILLLF
ncbi:hypothetical protein GEMRC1_002633 [Eukaryota sp. GEM-RC1]